MKFTQYSFQSQQNVLNLKLEIMVYLWLLELIHVKFPWLFSNLLRFSPTDIILVFNLKGLIQQFF